MNLNIKIRGNDKKDIFKILMILVVINILISVLVVVFANIEILKTILLYIMSIVYIGIVIYIIKKENEEIIKPKEPFKNKYDPILTRFLIKNEFILDNTLLNAEIYYLMQKGYIYFDKEKNILKLKDRSLFKSIDALEKIDSNKIKEYSTDEIPSYESMFINKIVCAFHDEIDIKEFKKKQKENYYLQRGEICKLTMEKMILYEIEKKNMMAKSGNLNYISIAGILNIITSIILFMVIGRFNIVLLLATIINIALSVIMIKNENILAYKYSEEVRKYIDDLLEYVDMLKKENKNVNEFMNSQETVTEDLQENENIQNNEVNGKEEEINRVDSDEELKILFGLNNDEDLYI